MPLGRLSAVRRGWSDIGRRNAEPCGQVPHPGSAFHVHDGRDLLLAFLSEHAVRSESSWSGHAVDLSPPAG
jgi:hypothetical protein